MKIPTMRTESSKQGLRNMIAYINKKTPTKELRLVEIGTFTGDSTKIFANNFKYVIAIDPYVSNRGDITNTVNMKQIKQIFLNNMKGLSNYELIEDFSYNAVKYYDNNSVDIIYIDGMHSYDSVIKDIGDWLPKIKITGWITGHDYRSNKFPGVVRAVNMFCKPEAIFMDYSWVIKKKSIEDKLKRNFIHERRGN